MQLNQEFEPVMKSSNKLETQQASIAMTAHMFQVLSAAIYQHPERACVRELSCNAFDGHVAAGNAHEPFRVHLPNPLEPWFEVRDYGTGMSHEQVMKLYLTYGASTKRDSNDLIGGLGIGSKSPFAVAQSFTVTSWFGGVVRRYSVYMEEGIPQVTKLTETPSTEPNGVAVRVAIPMNKIDIFEAEARRIYTHFPVKPICNKELTGIYDGLAVMAEEPGEFKIYSGVNRSNTINTSIVMGNIEYPINMNEVLTNISDVIPDFLRVTIERALIYLPIGSVNIAASRESLQLTEATKKSIIAVFEKVAKRILSSFQSKVDAATNLYEAIEIFNKALGKGIAPMSLMKNITFKGKTLSEWYAEQEDSRTRVVRDINGDVVKGWDGKDKREPAYEPLVGISLFNAWRNADKRLELHNYNNSNHFSMFRDMQPAVLRNVVFAIEDRFQKNGSRKTVGRAAILKEIAEVVYKERNNRDGMLYLVPDEAAVTQLCALHHYPKDVIKIVKMSTYEYAYVPKKVERGQVKVWKAESDSFREEKVDLSSYDDAQYYIKAEGNDLASPGLRQGSDLKDISLLLSSILPTERVFMFRKTVWGKIPEDWIEVDVNILTEIVKERPELYIEMNRRRLLLLCGCNKIRLDNMNVMAVAQFENKYTREGYVQTERSTGRTLPGAVNFEDNLELFHKFFGRPQIVFGDIFYRKWQWESSPLEKLVSVLPTNSKLYHKIQKALARIKKVHAEEIKKSKENNPLVHWIDWNKVNFKTFAESQGYKLTDFVNK